MLAIEYVSKIALVVISVILFLISFGVVVAIQFQNKQSKKYKECLQLIKEKEDGTLTENLGMDLTKIDENVDVNKLMDKLYNIYLDFVEKFNNNDKSINSILDDFISKVYHSKIEIYESKNTREITNDIELVNYSLLNYEKNRVEFRINITCFNYKIMNDTIISGSNLERVEQIFIVTFVKDRKKWLINNIEKVYEKKLSI